jgi:hypothetical protein
MGFVVEDVLSLECYKIILAIHRTGIFSSRAPNKDKPSKLHIQVAKWLHHIYNGGFICSINQNGLRDFPISYLNCLIGDWTKIESAVVNSIPTDRPMYNDMATFFWNSDKQISRFLYGVNIKAYDTPKVTPQDIKELKRRELPNDVSRCTEIMCPKAELCQRVKSKGTGNYAVMSTFLFDENGCDSFIGE